MAGFCAVSWGVAGTNNSRGRTRPKIERNVPPECRAGASAERRSTGYIGNKDRANLTGGGRSKSTERHDGVAPAASSYRRSSSLIGASKQLRGCSAEGEPFQIEQIFRVVSGVGLAKIPTLTSHRTRGEGGAPSAPFQIAIEIRVFPQPVRTTPARSPAVRGRASWPW